MSMISIEYGDIETDRVRALAKGRPFEVVEAGWGLGRPYKEMSVSFFIVTKTGWLCTPMRGRTSITDEQIMLALTEMERSHWRARGGLVGDVVDAKSAALWRAIEKMA
jgi:hypothetical protein